MLVWLLSVGKHIPHIKGEGCESFSSDVHNCTIYNSDIMKARTKSSGKCTGRNLSNTPNGDDKNMSSSTRDAYRMC